MVAPMEDALTAEVFYNLLTSLDIVLLDLHMLIGCP